ncbi:HaeIII family restriction endonuclease [Clostridium baratii]|uniref:HaeIII family restriction endonuclease n=1 Tax=Clostridium baratii TaxID=1561 RepID=UPI001C00A9D4|nr:HaeIII family restriction endonuclease [Clostridium baratii]
MPVSNTLGRAFEYALCQKIDSKFDNITLTDRAVAEQSKDKRYYDALNSDEKSKYDISTNRICSEWLNLKLISSNMYTLDRLPDSAGVNGDVTDIRLEAPNAIVNISLKHNHNALKHPRLTRVPKWIDINTDSKYASDYKNIWDSFLSKANTLSSTATLFNELIAIEANFVFDNLYNPLCKLVSNYLTENIKTSSQVESLFKFMVGKYDFYKIIDNPDCVLIQDFIDLKMPKNVKIEQTDKSYIKMTFNNGVILNLRLHTASSRISTKSVKFDVRGSFDDIDSITIKKN